MIAHQGEPMPSIIIVSGPSEGDYYPLKSATVVVGRQETCPIQVADDRVSRKHLQIRQQDAKHYALDMKSANGVWINGRKMDAECELADQDEIVLGDSKLIYNAQEFPDRESAFTHYKQRGERHRSTLQQ